MYCHFHIFVWIENSGYGSWLYRTFSNNGNMNENTSNLNWTQTYTNNQLNDTGSDYPLAVFIWLFVLFVEHFMIKSHQKQFSFMEKIHANTIYYLFIYNLILMINVYFKINEHLIFRSDDVHCPWLLVILLK